MPSGVGVEVHTKRESGDNEHAPQSKAENRSIDSQEMVKKENKSSSKQISRAQGSANEESVEVVLEHGASKVLDSTDQRRPSQDQSIFRHPQAVRPKAMRASHGPPPPPPPPPPPHQPYLHGSGSWGYGPPRHHIPYPPPPPPPPPHGPYPVPPYNLSGSFDDQGSYHHHTPHYSPHIQYPPPRYSSEDVNVISPNHKEAAPYYRPPITPRPRHIPPSQPYYHYPPTSPVSRPSAPAATGHPKARNYAVRRGESLYPRSHPDDAWSSYPPPPPPHASRPPPGRPHPPVVAESFDSEHHSRSSSHPPTPGGSLPPPQPPAPPPSHDPHYQFYGGGGSWGSFDSTGPPPPQYDEHRYYGFPPDSPYSPYAGAPPAYSPGAIYPTESFPPPGGVYGVNPPPPSFSYSYDDEEKLLKDYHPDRDGEVSQHKHVTPPGASKVKSRSKSGTPVASNKSGRNMVLPKAAEEVDFDVTDPPLEPVFPPSDGPVCDALTDVNTYDVLLGRGGGTNSQVGNRRFRKLVQDFQPTYLMAKRKEKPLLARTIVLIIRKRGGRFLKKDEDSGELFEVGDLKAEAKTSQALREGLDVRATKSAASSLVDKKKKKKLPKSPHSAETSPSGASSEQAPDTPPRPVESPPTLPKLQVDDVKDHSPSPENMQFRKRRRMRSTDRFFPDFCPPRADLGRSASPPPADDDDGVLQMATTPIRRNNTRDEDYESVPTKGCAGIALDMVTGAATESFCLGPTSWRR